MTHASEGLTHWYDQAGQPAYEVKAANGSMRPTTLRDARKLQLVPSVSGIIKCADRPALNHWLSEQLLLSALTLPRLPDESESAWLNRVRHDSREQGRKAAKRGKDIHESLQGYFDGQTCAMDHLPHVWGAVKEIKKWAMPETWVAEASFTDPLGFGGKVDLHSSGFVLDFKTKEFDEDKYPDTYDEHFMQLAAYREGLRMPEARCAIVFVSVSVPGLAHLVELPEPELEKGWAMFEGLLDFWYAKTGLKR